MAEPGGSPELDAGLSGGDPGWEVTMTCQCYQQLRSIYHARTPGRRPPGEQNIAVALAAHSAPLRYVKF